MGRDAAAHTEKEGQSLFSAAALEKQGQSLFFGLLGRA